MEKGYGWLAGALRMVSKADGVVLVVLGGVDGNGYQFTGDPTTCRRLPEVLRDVANNIEADLEEGSRIRADRRAKDGTRAFVTDSTPPLHIVVSGPVCGLCGAKVGDDDQKPLYIRHEFHNP